MTIRRLTSGEKDLARSVYGNAIDLEQVEICDRRWWPLQPRHVVMAPRGRIHFHPHGGLYRDDFAAASLGEQGLFIHEMCHVWQHQRGIFLPLARHPFCRYHYSFVPGRPLARYGIEQQAEIVRHAFLLRAGARVIGAPDLSAYESVLPFGNR
ncbi:MULTISPECIES: vgr related protein [unclassified Sphingomonas]|uniref:vgr related protein n=1 Tax=unclassified Sphingomonas TaxID=196159 RepID=UPI001D110212|nr:MULTISPECIES: vgr related protein [unclassified Sphingomonas]MCC2979405.1 vgr related protein [Sphingomonas sp. IC4-52]MCD2315367.1 vgr related protein [Sphingomonas sp. IC-11]